MLSELQYSAFIASIMIFWLKNTMKFTPPSKGQVLTIDKKTKFWLAFLGFLIFLFAFLLQLV